MCQSPLHATLDIGELITSYLLQDRKRFAQRISKSNPANLLPSAAFDYDCRALDGPNDPLVRSYDNFMYVDDTPSLPRTAAH